MNNPVWEWLVNSRLNAYQATQRMDGPSAIEAGPGWCFDRFGQSATPLQDGRVVHIAGEHEDCYDADFFIYNDVVVAHPNGKIDIFGYPTDVFPQTDFHSATLVGDRVIVIGNLGYVEARREGVTPVYLLDLKDFMISPAPALGDSPGWIHGHSARLSEDDGGIIFSGGSVHREADRLLVENFDDWRLSLSGWRWERLTERQWECWEFRRKDARPNCLFDFEMEWLRRGIEAEETLPFEAEGESLEKKIGKTPDFEAYARRYRPDLPHESTEPREDRIHEIRVRNVPVHYAEDSLSVRMTVRGELSADIVSTLAADLKRKLSEIENTPWESRKLIRA